jgi:ABC-type multidrug transport system permease subunit
LLRDQRNAVAALVHREFLVARSYPVSLVLDLVFGAINLVVYYFISRTFAHPSHDLQGADSYFAYVAVGVAMVTVIQSAGVSLARRVREEQLTGSFEALTAQPVGPVVLALGLAGFPCAFAAARAVVYVAFAQLVLGLGLTHPDWLGAFTILLTTAALVATVGITLAAFAVVVARSDAVTNLAAFGLGALGGAFFPLVVLPAWLQSVTDFVPTRFSFHGARAALFEGSGWGHDALALVASTVILAPVSVALFGAAIELGRRRGTLTRG